MKINIENYDTMTPEEKIAALENIVPTDAEVEALLQAYQRINPREVMLYSIDRATPEEQLEKVEKPELETIAQRFRAAGIKVQVN